MQCLLKQQEFNAVMRLLVIAYALFQPIFSIALTFFPCPKVLTKVAQSESHILQGRILHANNFHLHKKPFVETIVNEIKQQNRSDAPRTLEPAEKLAVWLQYIEKAVDSESAIDEVKKVFLTENIVSEKEISEGYYNLQVKIARELGHGTIELTPERKSAMAAVGIKDQEESFSQWLDYLLSKETQHYPMWAKIWTLSGVSKLGNFDPETSKFERQSRGTLRSFPELNREALAFVIEEIQKSSHLKPMPSFETLYGKHLSSTEKSKKNLTITEGKWVRYPKGSSPDVLVESLKGKNTGWCTAATETAKKQLEGGDFHVYYSNDNSGKPTIPRLAIRMENSKIGEVRGVSTGQHVDSEISKSGVLEEKLQDFGTEGGVYKKKSNDMAVLTKIEQKNKDKQALTTEEIEFLYELNGPISGFGYQADPRIKEIIQARNLKEDISRVTQFQQSEISNDPLELSTGKVKYFYGDVILKATSPDGLKLPQVVDGGLDLRHLTSAEGLKLPDSVHGNLLLSKLTSAEGLKLPESVGGNLGLPNLTSVKGITFPTSVGGGFFLNSIISAEGLKLPNVIRGDLNLDKLVSSQGLKLPDSVEKDLRLNGLSSMKGVKLPNSVGGNVVLGGLTSAEELKLPESIGGSIVLNRLVSAKGLKLPDTFKGGLILSGLTSAEGLKLPSSVGGDLYLSQLTSAVGLKLPNSIGGALELAQLTSKEGLNLPDSIGGILYLNSLTSVEGLKLPKMDKTKIYLAR